MHSTERVDLILKTLSEQGFVSFQTLDRVLGASPATIRRDLHRLETEGRIVRVRGGARLAGADKESIGLKGTPFHENVRKNAAAKAEIGRLAAALCRPGESVIIDGGSTTVCMCPHLAALKLQVLTNSLHIVTALLPQTDTRVSVPGGNIFREQDIILSPFEDDGMGGYRATKFFTGAAAIGPYGLLQTDILIAQAELRLLERADQLVVLVDSSKFDTPAGHAVCPLEDIDILVTDDGISDATAQMIERAGVNLLVAQVERQTEVRKKRPLQRKAAG